jgi:hypothetical protein
MGDGTALEVQTSDATIVAWRLARLHRAPPVPAVAPATSRPPNLLVLNQTFDRAWQVDGAAEHLPTALGTNVFLTSNAARATARFAFSAQYHVAFAIGTLALGIALCAGIAFLVTGVQGRRSGLREGLRP